ncbi:MAG: heavy metal translocating P-type ATPase [bacterium]|nr:heavy metal translocating P-type ATPase [bacterium]
MKNISFNIKGMHCASCVVRNEKALKKVPGVEDASVNFALKQATVSYDETRATEHDLHNAIRQIGYEVPAHAAKSHGEHASAAGGMQHADGGGDEHMHHGEVGEARKKAVWALSISAPVAVIGMFGLEFGGEFFGHTLSMWLMAALSTAVILYFGWQFHRGMINEMRHASPGMDTLISLGTLAALFYSIWALQAGRVHDVYFETGAIITALILLGKYFEAKSTGQASEAIKKLLQLGAKTARVSLEGREVEVPIENVQAGDMLIVKPGEKIPTDGIIIKGSAAIDESMLTGESVPADKKEGDEIFGATLNTNGSLQVRATKVGENTILAQIVKMVSDAQVKKAPIQRLADRISGIFVPIVLGIAAFTALGWYLRTGDAGMSIIPAVAVLVIACPCALGLATPTAIMVGTGLGARRGILIKNGEALEKAKHIDAVIFDKTGTLTQGKPVVTDVVAAGSIDIKEILRIAASIEKNSEHPLAGAIVGHAKSEGVTFYETEKFLAIPGKGIRGSLRIENGLRDIHMGTAQFLKGEGIETAALDAAWERLQSEGKTAMGLAVERRASGIVAVADTVKPDAMEAISKLKLVGITPVMITGDNHKTAQAVARQLGIDTVLAEVLPQDKAKEVQKLQSKGKRVAFVGDGINDAPALAQSDLGIAMGTGSDIAIETGSIVLVKGNPLKAVEAIRLSRFTFSVIKQNLFWAFFYNIAALPLAAFGLLNPMIAAGAMAFSSVSVVLNSLRIRRMR